MARINIPTPIRFKCQEGCSNCCTTSGGFVFIFEKDIHKISKFLKMSEDDFLNTFTKKVGTKISLIDRDEKDCVFLKNNKCSIYPVRPVQCRTFPFWPQNMKTEKRWNLIQEECPGIGKGRLFTRDDIEDIFKGKSVDSQK
ncbi:MAG: YkgJ family cysteine cluster protein [Calditrichaeota bacterium]|nr:YkgJ family cysteine cluster protein [Calditrichota bacterium]